MTPLREICDASHPDLSAPMEQILSKGDFRLKMSASWELVKLKNGPPVREIK